MFMTLSKRVRAMCRGLMMLAAVTLTSCLGPFRHPSPKGFCNPPSQSGPRTLVVWRDRRVEPLPAPRDVARRLTGTWDLLKVTTEGSDPAEVERSRIRFVATDSATWRKCTAPCRGDLPVVVVAAAAP